jgi:2,4-dienoyl-CoA reductase-like NADH-dependent reductase (Old Yellow Enzyme family)
MSILFSPTKIGDLELKNRFVRSATFEAMASEDGRVTDELIRVYRNLAKGEVGLAILSLVYVHRSGQSYPRQTGLHTDEMIPGLERLVQAVHDEGGRILVQLTHGGRQGNPAVLGWRPKGPSAKHLDPNYLYLPREMDEGDIQEVIRAFGEAARRAAEAGADGIQLHGAHTYLLGQFLSPFFNARLDRWGSSAENRFRLVKEVFKATREAVPATMPVTIKLNSHDHTPRRGVTPRLAERYAGWLAELGIDAVELSAGSVHFSYMNMSRGSVPTRSVLSVLPLWKRPVAWVMLRRLEARPELGLEEAYNLEAARQVKPALGQVPLILVGGVRTRETMEQVLGSGTAELISMSRPFLREPNLVKKLREGRADSAACISCNNCLAAAAGVGIPVRCYVRGLPR